MAEDETPTPAAPAVKTKAAPVVPVVPVSEVTLDEFCRSVAPTVGYALIGGFRHSQRGCLKNTRDGFAAALEAYRKA